MMDGPFIRPGVMHVFDDCGGRRGRRFVFPIRLPFYHITIKMKKIIKGYAVMYVCYLCRRIFSGKELWLTFEGIAHKAEVFINGKKARQAIFCGYTAFSVNIAPYVHFGCETVLL